MSQKIACDREGSFRGRITEYGLKEFASGTVAVKYRADLDEIWDGEQWCPWAEYDMEVFGDSFVIKKDGTLNEAAVNSLVNHAGWDGKFSSIQDTTWQPTPCQFSVKKSEYEGKVYFNAAFVNGFDDTPGGSMPKLEDGKAKSLDQRFASQLRAVTGNKMRNQAPVPEKSKPSAPPKAEAKKDAPKRETVPAGDDIPF